MKVKSHSIISSFCHYTYMKYRMKAMNFVYILLLATISFTPGECDTKVFNLKDYGAVEGGNVDISQALLKAWGDACNWKGGIKLEVPSATYLVNPIILKGPCRGPIEFHNSGTLKAPPGLRGDSWIEFQYIDGLTLNGGVFDGQGPPKQAAPGLPTLLKFTFITNSSAQLVKLINSQSTHFHLFGCKQIVIDQVRISSPGDSPNTDGIKIGESNGIKISKTNIESGDDCVALIRGSKDITVTGVTCGPGHGISIGSLGESENEQVEHVVVRQCRLFDTTNGLRIKTKASDMSGTVSNITYQDISFQNVDNPIIFDQNYCPSRTCRQGNSRVQIKDVKFKNVHGTSKINTAVVLQCSGSNPCKGIELKDINIAYYKYQASTISNCSNVHGQSSGIQIPKPCISV